MRKRRKISSGAIMSVSTGEIQNRYTKMAFVNLMVVDRAS
jgi:hypothetical protein